MDNNLLHAVNQAAALLLTVNEHEKIEERLIRCMEVIGNSVDADRVHLWRNEINDGEWQFIHTYAWLSEIGKQNPVIPSKAPPHNKMEDWKAQFLRNEYMGGPVSAMSEEERNYFSVWGIKSVFLIPLFVADHFWGLVSIDDCVNERSFTEEEINMLRSVGLMMVSAIHDRSLIEKVNDANERMALMLDTSPVCTQVWDRNLNTIDCNESGVRLYGFKNKQEYVERFLQCCSPEFQPDGLRSDEKAVALVNRAFKEGKCSFDWMHKMPDEDTLIPAKVTLVRATYKGDEVVLGYTQDMREQIAKDATLEALVNERTNELALQTEALHNAREAAEFANRAKSSFLAKMSHEIRTPMNTILGVTDIILQNEGLPEEQVQELTRISNAGDMLLGIINDILDFSKIEEGKMDLIVTPYKTAHFINDSVQLNLIRVQDRAIVFILEVDENLPMKLIGDELRVKQILSNLLSNAFKYTDEGTVTLKVTGEPIPGTDEITMVISVSDTGRGMTPEQVGQLFDAYTRFDQEVDRSIEGTGLGLTITNRLITLMEGSIEIESEPKVGSTFTVRLKQKKATDEVLGKEEVENLQQFKVNQVNRSKRGVTIRVPMPYGRILVVDDVEPNLYVAEGLMKPYNMKIDVALSGFDAIDKVKDGKEYHLIFMDHMMPKMDGIETTRKLREMGYTRPIVALTANAIVGQAEVFLENGFDDFTTKPIDLRQLDYILNKYVRETQGDESIIAIEGATPPPTVVSVVKGKAIPGMDIEKGLVRYNNDEDVYLKILRSYVAGLRTMLDEIEAMPTENLHDYKIKVHGIKGASMDIFARQVGESAAALETAANNKDTDYIRQHNPIFMEYARQLVQEIEEFFSLINAEKVLPKKDKIDAVLLAQLREACAGYDMNAADTAMAEIEGFAYEAHNELAAWLRDNVDMVNYTEIVEKLGAEANEIE